MVQEIPSKESQGWQESLKKLKHTVTDLLSDRYDLAKERLKEELREDRKEDLKEEVN